jgi:hypothetical protein
VDEIDVLVIRVRANGPVPVLLDGWDQASVWGWDETTDSLYAHLWRNTDDPAQMSAIRIGPDECTPVITCPVTLALHIAMAIDRDPWKVFGALDRADVWGSGAGDDWDVGNDLQADEGGTVVSMTEGHSLPEWPYTPRP